jgi:hypothetical protein
MMSGTVLPDMPLNPETGGAIDMAADRLAV